MSTFPEVFSLERLTELPRVPRAVTIGNFDGVHRGHQSLLSVLQDKSVESAAERCALTFYPHPAAIVAPQRNPKLLTTLTRRIELLRRYGAEEVVILHFDEKLASLGPEEFVRIVLVDGLRASSVVVGANFRFAREQEGNVDTLNLLGRRFGFQVHSEPLLRLRGLAVSSSTVRRLLARGEVAKVTRLLGRPFSLQGDVIAGRGVGSKQTVPTLNLSPWNEVLPADGVYVTRTTDAMRGATYPSITNVGVRPTFEDGHSERTVETFLLGPLISQPAEIEVEFLHWLRAEQRFATPDLLRAQILQDVESAQRLHRRILRWQPGLLRIMELMMVSPA